ncbi:MAG: acyltransferase [Verrucomicrobiae bacterium]|nr:acyltransferase [Verrucomicrobiae bacterium]
MRKLILKTRRKFDKYLNRCRIWKLRLLGAQIGRGVRCYGKIILHGDPRNLTIGEGAALSAYVLLNCRDRLTIGKGAVVSAFAQIYTAGLDLTQRPPRDHASAPVVIEDYAWLAGNVIVSAGVTVGKYSCVAAGSVVTEDVKPGWLYGGVPAKPIKPLEAVAAEMNAAQTPAGKPNPVS